MNASIGIADAAATLRRAFDGVFAEAPRVESRLFVNLLLLRAGDAAYALRLSDIAGLHRGLRISRLPSPTPMLLGISAFRGGIVPVYDLRALLGHVPAADARWVVLAGQAPAFGLAFDEFEGQVRVPSEAIAPADRPGAAQGLVREMARVDQRVRSILHMPSVIETVGRQIDRATTREEQ
ncbi:MAG: chemotaxis protein CheW [Proteobacteria bacterium]|nr:chemotaxis protein CheW [Pseudomonadota bacterium]